MRLIHGDCFDALRTLPDCTVDAVVTDPPYGLEFMGKEWDRPWASRFTGIRDGAPLPDRSLHVNPRCRSCGGYQRGTKNKCSCLNPDWASSQAEAVSKIARAFQEWCREWGEEVYRVLKPGAHLLAFGGTRTYHRLTCGLEDAGFEIRDTIQWLYGSGFPKSLAVDKALTKAGLPCADDWAGFGTALKPAHEPIVLARKPLDSTVAGTVTRWGTGAINIDGCRVNSGTRPAREQIRNGVSKSKFGQTAGKSGMAVGSTVAGRWPANVALTHPDCEDGCVDGCPVAELDRQSGKCGANPVGKLTRLYEYSTDGQVPSDQPFDYGDSGGASRFFPTFRYQAKPSAREKNTGVDDRNTHPTVKPVELMRWLIRLITPPGGTVLDPFAGSGTTLVAATLEGFDTVGVEAEADYLPIVEGRVRWAESQCEQMPLMLEAD